MFDLVIRGGTLIMGAESLHADLAIQDGRIAAIGQNLAGRRSLPAEGLLVLPGAVDPHVHIEMPVGATRSSDDWLSGTIAAAFGGTTSVIDFVEPQPGESLAQALAARRALAQGQTAIDFGLHMTLIDDSPATLEQVGPLCAAGCTSFKTYLTYAGFCLSDAALLNVLACVQAAGGVTLVHAESDAIIAFLKRRLQIEKQSEPVYHALARPAVAEAEAIQRALALAQAAGARLYVVHVSSAAGAQAIRAARRRGLPAFGETCAQYLLLDESELARPDFQGAKFVCSPPLRAAEDRAALWQALAADELQTVGSDHCPFNFEGQKTLGRSGCEQIPAGLPGIEARLALVYAYGVCTGQISLERWVQVCCTNPARIFGLYPRKGALLPGSDADVVLFDPDKRVTLSHAMLHEQVDYTPYEGLELRGMPVTTLLRGRVIVEDGVFTGRPGQGQYLARQAA
jgi:dihydropyrimidinase